MMERGCKNFVFISRSGADKPEAAQVTASLQKAGASVRVFRADATIEKDVMGVVADVSATHQIRGLVHAPMVLQVRLDSILAVGNRLIGEIGWHI